jgi:muramoyltetrapeptide carboxypeptidase LdcA involved in peptidoglycan recycling
LPAPAGIGQDGPVRVIPPKLRPGASVPVIANVDFGHTIPILTFPVGGTVEVRAEHGAPRLTITSH